MNSPFRLLQRSLCLLILLLTVQGLSYQSISGYRGHPSISSIGRIYRVQVGEILTLPCDVHNLGPMVLMWKKGQRVLTAGNLIVKRDKRIALHKHHLVLSNLNIHDGGEYSCEIETDDPEPLAVTHTVEILVPPSIMPQPRNGHVVVRKGTSVTIECRSNGNPTPVVSWTRKGNPLSQPLEETSNNGMTLTLHNVGRNDSGGYKCRASNGVGKTAAQFIRLKVLYEPEVHVPHRVVHGGINRTSVLSCRVHAEPDPDVKWMKNSQELMDSGGRYKVSFDGKREYSLSISNVGIEDFASYACSAINSLGKDQRIVRLSGAPDRPKVESILGIGNTSWRISWSTFSYVELSQFRIMYRYLPSSHIDVEPAFKWKDVIPMEDLQSNYRSIGNPALQKSSYILQGLRSASSYEIHVQAKNSFGWSDKSHTKKFFTNEIPTVKKFPLSTGAPFPESSFRGSKDSSHSNSLSSSEGDSYSRGEVPDNPRIILPERKHLPHFKKSNSGSRGQLREILFSLSFLWIFWLT